MATCGDETFRLKLNNGVRGADGLVLVSLVNKSMKGVSSTQSIRCFLMPLMLEGSFLDPLDFTMGSPLDFTIWDNVSHLIWFSENVNFYEISVVSTPTLCFSLIVLCCKFLSQGTYLFLLESW
ncbi:hypothetical protein C5167_035472 [Papaver somniferum]|uniref:Uncharacterized protein n=1 Tax=Papaver somniferum TaxID=3469 RepID=A0A4Y7KG42_PAPSO|nr:hypothetical protein C5167_035472 [Papaver somniferum]